MNLNGLINQIMRRLTSWGVNKGIDTIAAKGKPAGQMTDAQRRTAGTAREAVKRARKAAQLTRRMGR